MGDVAIRVGDALAAVAWAAVAAGATPAGVAEAVEAVAAALAAVARPHGGRPPVQFFIDGAQLDIGREVDTTSLHDEEMLARGVSGELFEMNYPPEVVPETFDASAGAEPLTSIIQTWGCIGDVLRGQVKDPSQLKLTLYSDGTLGFSAPGWGSMKLKSCQSE